MFSSVVNQSCLWGWKQKCFPQIFPGSWRSGCLLVDFMNEDTTGSLTNASTTVTSSSMTKVASSLASCSIKWPLNAFQCTHIDSVISFTGDIVSVYRKSHLFDVELPEKGVSLKESAFTIPGPTLVSPVQTPIGKVWNDPKLFAKLMFIWQKSLAESDKIVLVWFCWHFFFPMRPKI